MLEALEDLLLRYGLNPTGLILFGIGMGCLIGVVGLYGAFSEQDSPSRRFRPRAATRPGAEARPDIIKEAERDPAGLMKALIPAERAKRTRIQRQLAHAGFRGKNAVAKFYLVRALLGILLPSLLLALIFIPADPMPAPLAKIANLSRLQTFQLLTVLMAVGFFAPTYWLRAKTSARQRALEEGFPNALDLMQISAEAGLGFDAAMARVAAEIQQVSPEIAEEFLITQREILAGRGRDKALMDMAERMNIDEAASFASVVLQSMRFGTSISEALLTYASEMRQRRELRAQEKANKLPVQMSGVMACLLLPALFMIALSPTVIRYIRYFAER